MTPLLLLILIPFAAALLVTMLRPATDQARNLVLLSALLANAVLAVALVKLHTLVPVMEVVPGGWNAGHGTAFAVDGLSALFLAMTNVILFLTGLYSTGYAAATIAPRKRWTYHVFLLMLAAGVNGTLMAADLFTAFIFMEMTALCAYTLTAYNRTSQSYEASFKYAVMGTLSSLFVLLAIAFIYTRYSALNYAVLASVWQHQPTPWLALVTFLLLTGLALKATLVPFHVWAPDAYAAAPAPAAAAFTATVSKTLGIYLILRLFFTVIGPTALTLHVIASLGALSLIVAVTLALYQWDFRRLLAYHSISQIGYVMLGIGLGTPLGVIGGLFHLLNHSVFKSLLFFNAGAVEIATGKRSLKDMGGLAQKMPVTATTSMIASLSISGIPPFNGFWSKFIIIVACIAAGKYLFAAVAVIGSILTLSSFLKIQRYAFYGYLRDTLETVREVPFSMLLPMILLAMLCLGMGILLLPGIDVAFLGSAANVLLSGIAAAGGGR